MNFLTQQLALMSTQFHWLRPWWLLAVLPILLLGIALWKQKRHAHQWQNIIAPELLPFLLDIKTISHKKSLLWALILAWLIGTIALAGPSWVKRPTAVEKNQNSLVILLDLSLSMFSEDVKPSRIARARLKIADILRERKDGQTALVVYAGEAHTVTPMSDDSATILSLLPSLSPNIMPLQGSNTEAAIERGIQLLHDAGETHGNLLLITDGVVPEAFTKINQLLNDKKIQLSILGVGTNQPAPIASGNGGFLRDKQGAIITTQLNNNELNELASQVHGRYSDIANNNDDIDFLMPTEEKTDASKSTLAREFDQWFDQGHWLVFLLLPIVLLSFKRGIILMLICIPLIGITPTPAYALGLDGLGLDELGLKSMWLTQDQQAEQALQKGDAKQAAEQFENPDWKASAQYRAGDYAAAAESFAKSDAATAHYNRGNALAKANKLEDAIKAYDEALKRDPQLEDAKKNRTLIEKLLKQQKQQEQQNKDQNKDSDQKDQDKQDQKDSKDQDKQNSDDQKQQEQNKQDKDKQNQDPQDKKEQDKKDQNSDQKNSSGSNTSAANQDATQKDGQNSSVSDAKQQGQTSSAAGQHSAANAAQQSSEKTQDQQKQEEQEEQAQVQELDPNKLTEEQKQALEQWLRRVPDDPGGLLRNKFKYQYQQNRQKKADGEFESPKNNADQRW